MKIIKLIKWIKANYKIIKLPISLLFSIIVSTYLIVFPELAPTWLLRLLGANIVIDALILLTYKWESNIKSTIEIRFQQPNSLFDTEYWKQFKEQQIKKEQSKPSNKEYALGADLFNVNDKSGSSRIIVKPFNDNKDETNEKPAS